MQRFLCCEISVVLLLLSWEAAEDLGGIVGIGEFGVKAGVVSGDSGAGGLAWNLTDFLTSFAGRLGS